ncbi:MAG: hypothetical protein ACJ79I_03665 [Gemmatimonadaceae bacterium]
MLIRTTLALSAVFLLAASAQAQQGYEFEVYGTKIAARGEGELELHTNFVPSGSQLADDAEGRASHRAFRSSLELSTGISSWLEASLYAVSYARSGTGVQYVGNRLRLTSIAPKNWHLPFAAGLSQEVGYSRPGFAENRWGYEITPILEKNVGPVNLVLNPAFERGLGSGEHEWEFEPRAQAGYALGDDAGIGIEYYSVLGPVSSFDPRPNQHHQLFATGRAELASGVEAGIGIGRGLTRNSDRWVVTTRFELEF